MQYLLNVLRRLSGSQKIAMRILYLFRICIIPLATHYEYLIIKWAHIYCVVYTPRAFIYNFRSILINEGTLTNIMSVDAKKLWKHSWNWVLSSTILKTMVGEIVLRKKVYHIQEYLIDPGLNKLMINRQWIRKWHDI